MVTLARKQSFLLALWSTLWLIPLLLTTGPNIVTLTFEQGSDRFWAGQDPFAPATPGRDAFHYSPFFAMAYRLFCSMPGFLHSVSWVFFNAWVFWWAVGKWFQLSKKTSLWEWVALVGCAMELDISLRYQQTNPLLVGTILLGVASVRDGSALKGGLWLAFGANLKFIPGLFGLFLSYPPKKRFLVGLIGGSLLLWMAPALVVGWGQNIQLHWNQYRYISTDMVDRHLMDIKSCLERLGHGQLGSFLWQVVFGTSLSLLGISRLVFAGGNFPWRVWISLGLTLPLLVIPRVESPTFVLIAPAYLLLITHPNRFVKGIVCASLFFITVIYTSAWPRALEFGLQKYWSTKTLGVFGLWVLCILWLMVELKERLLRPISASFLQHSRLFR